MTEPQGFETPLLRLISRRDLLARATALSLSMMAGPLRASGAGAQPGEARGVPSRDELERQFLHAPQAYAPVDNWWWEAGHVSKEKITWQLQELKDKGIGGSWFYVRWLYGEALSSDPAYWTNEWWELTRFALEEHRRIGLTQWFSNWTSLEFQQDSVRREREQNPAFWGRRLVLRRAESGEVLELDAGDELLEAAAYRRDGDSLDYSSRTLLNETLHERQLSWQAPEPGWVVTALVAQPWDLNYLDGRVGQRFAATFLGEYEKRVPEFLGSTLEAFGADEMELLTKGEVVTTPFSPALLERVRTRRGYDLAPHLIGLFHDIGPKTDQVRCDYYDALSSLLEENFYRPPTKWLESRGMQHATLSQQGAAPLSQTMHYADFFRYMRTFHVPGNEDPFWSKPGKRRLFGSKVSSSIAHLHGRERVVLCVHYGTGWGQTFEENLAWTNEAYAKGLNLYCRHGAYYTLMGGWYEWVPPADHFYQPHWRYWREFARYVTRLSYLLSQGKHRADVALLYPISTLHASWIAGLPAAQWGSDAPAPGNQVAKKGVLESLDEVLEGEEGPFAPAGLSAARAVQDLTAAIYHDGMDLDLVHDDSLEQATVRDGVLEIAGVEFRSIVLPSASTMRLSSMKKVREFFRAGGTVICFGTLPSASAEHGRNDPRMRELSRSIFGANAESSAAVVHRSNAAGGKAYFVPTGIQRVPEILSGAIVRALSAAEKDLFLLHKSIGETEVFFIFNVRPLVRKLPVRFRAQGRAEIWDAFTGEIRPVRHWKRVGAGLTELMLEIGPTAGVVVVFSPGATPAQTSADDLSSAPKILRLPERFAFRLEPTMDNRWGDFRYPPTNTLIGAEARRFRYAEEEDTSGTAEGWHRAEFDDSKWPETTYSYGPYWWHIGGFSSGSAPSTLIEQAKRGVIDIQASWGEANQPLRWHRYDFSMKYGNATILRSPEPFMQLFEGLVGVPENFLVLDQPAPGDDAHYFLTHVRAPKDGDYVLHAGVSPGKPLASASRFDESDAAHSGLRVPQRVRAWVNGAESSLEFQAENPASHVRVRLRQGWNAVLLEVIRPEAGPVAFHAAFYESSPPEERRYVPLLRWFREPQPFVYDITPEKKSRIGWYRFRAPPGMRSMHVPAQAKAVSAWIDGKPAAIANGVLELSTPFARGAQVALRVEQVPGAYGGAAFPEPVQFECGNGEISASDWSAHGLATYSGIGVYSQSVRLDNTQVQGRVFLDLGNVRHVAEVFVNGKAAGVKLARPFSFDITRLVQEGSNQLEIKVANTLANHMSTYPTQWVLARQKEPALPAPAEAQTVSGLLGPVELLFYPPTRLENEA